MQGDRVARDHSALAVSQGSDIFFRRGAYQPGTDRGDHVLRHEVAHYLQRGTPGTESALWSQPALEAEAHAAAAGREGPVRIRGSAASDQPLAIKTYVSTVGGNPYFDAAVEFYKLWENETAERIDSYQQIVEKLEGLKKVDKFPPKFRIVAHADGSSLFLPLVQGATSYASVTDLGLQTRRALAGHLGDLAHIAGDMTGVVHGWLDADSAGKPLLTKVGITAAPVDLWHEFFWWVVDEYYVTIVKELAATAGGTPQTTTKEMDDLKSEIRGAQGDLSKALAPGLPKGAAESDIAALRPAILKALKDDGRTFGNVDAGFFRQRLDRIPIGARQKGREWVASCLSSWDQLTGQ